MFLCVYHHHCAVQINVYEAVTGSQGRWWRRLALDLIQHFSVLLFSCPSEPHTSQLHTAAMVNILQFSIDYLIFYETNLNNICLIFTLNQWLCWDLLKIRIWGQFWPQILLFFTCYSRICRIDGLTNTHVTL